MYIDAISLENVRTFAAEKSVAFVHPDKQFDKTSNGCAEPRLKDVNLLFGENASGKTTLLEAIALASLGPAITDSRIAPRPLIRFAPKTRRASAREQKQEARIQTSLVLHDQEILAPPGSNQSETGESTLLVTQKGELESFGWDGSTRLYWERVYESRNDAFFVVAYGATRRVEQKIEFGSKIQRSTGFQRVRRIESIVQEGYPLVPLLAWFPQIKKGSDRWQQVIELINGALGQQHFVFEGQRVDGEYVFSQGGMEIPFRSLSDGYRGFLGWVGDLLYHLDYACADSKLHLAEIPGVVLVDEIDLHLHPRWQMEVVQNLATTFPRLQFIFTSHSPLVAGSVEWMNVTHLRLDGQHRSGVDAFKQPIFGLDADQILVSDLFGLESTRAQPKRDRLQELTIRARRGDDRAAKELISEMAKGLEGKK